MCYLLLMFLIWAKPGLFFVFFVPFLVTKTIKFLISTIQIEKSVGGVHGIRTQGHRMVGADKTMELFMSESSV